MHWKLRRISSGRPITVHRRDEALTVGIIGAGQGVRTHAKILSRLPKIRIVGVADLTVDLTRAALQDQALDPDKACTFEALQAMEPDLVCLATPPTVREQYVGPLADTPSALLIEKPLESSAGRARSVYAVLAGRSQPAFLNLQLRGLPAFRQVREIIQAGELGTVHSVLVRERTVWRRDSCQPWKASLASGGGQRLDLGPHLLDLAVFLLGGTYSQVLHSADSACGSVIPWPLATSGAKNDLTDAADAVFQSAFHHGSCWVSLYTTSIGTGPETFELDVEGTSGRLTFFYGPGGGTLTMYHQARTEVLRLQLASDGRLVDPEAAIKDPPRLSLFKLAYRCYVQQVLTAIRHGDGVEELASVEDGLANLAILDLMIGDRS
jgi:predicted dehydrogenase